jgi:branched-chain amino acid transport system substrate-binding protein
MADDAGIKLDKVAYLREQTEFGASVYRAFATEAQKQGFTVDPVLTYDSQQVTDLTPQITQIKAAGAKVLATTGYFRDGVLLAKAVASVRPDLDAVWGVASGAFDLPTFPTAAAGAGEGYFNSNYFFNSANPETVELRKQFQAKYNEEMRSGSILAYEAVRVVAKGLENGKSKDPKKLRDSISKVKIDNPYMATAGPIEFDETGENKNAAPVVVQVQQGKVAKIWPKDGADAKYRFPAK